jgi:hypothetical protein
MSHTHPPAKGTVSADTTDGEMITSDTLFLLSDERIF